MSTSSPNPKRQHFYAQAIQRNFLDRGEDKLWVYDRITNEYRQQDPSQIAVESHLYTLKHPGLKGHEYDIEKVFGELEGRAAPVFAKLRKGEYVTQNERNIICEFAGLQVFRTPEALAIINELTGRVSQYLFKEMILEVANMPKDEFTQHAKKIKADVSGVTQEDLRRSIEQKEFTIKQPEGYHLTLMMKQGAELGIEFSTRDWLVLHTKKSNSFIGSDCSVVQVIKGRTIEGAGFGPASPGMATILPFARDTALMISDTKNGTLVHGSYTSEGVKSLNSFLARNSSRIVFSHNKQLLESIVQRERLAEWRPKIIFDDKTIQENARKAFQNRN